MRKEKKVKGQWGFFTLIEFLIVVSITNWGWTGGCRQN